MIDWAGKWFEVRAERGQSDLVTMMYQDGGKPLQKIHFHHRETDGFGKLQKILKNEGLSIRPPIRPLKKPNRIFNFFLLIKALLIHPRLPHNPWKIFDPSKPSGQPDEVSHWFLNAAENQKIKSLAQKNQINLGFFIMSEMDKIIKDKLFKNPHDTGAWLCPVDVRGGYPETSDSHNFVSFVVTEFKGAHTPENIQNSFSNYRQELKKGTYWAYWEMAQIGKWIGVKGIRWLSKKGTSQSFWMGSFTDLGIWTQPEICHSHLKDRYWVIAPPGSPSYPVGISTMEWCGNRSISIKIHPAICDGRSTLVSEEILNSFKEKLLQA